MPEKATLHVAVAPAGNSPPTGGDDITDYAFWHNADTRCDGDIPNDVKDMLAAKAQ
jgi:hypothetical protein